MTLLEILVTFVVSSVVLVGLLTIFAQAAGDFNVWNRDREARFSRGTLETELYWTLRSVPTQPNGFRDPADWPAAVINDGNGPRTVLTYDLNRNLQGGRASLSNFDAWTGIVYQWESVVYRFEADQAGGMVGQPAPSFNLFSSGDLQAFCSALLNRRRSDILATGVGNLVFAPGILPNGDPTVRWSLAQF